MARQHLAQVVTVEKAVDQYHGSGVILDECFTQRGGLSQSVRGMMNLISQIDTELPAIINWILKAWCRDD